MSLNFYETSEEADKAALELERRHPSVRFFTRNLLRLKAWVVQVFDASNRFLETHHTDSKYQL